MEKTNEKSLEISSENKPGFLEKENFEEGSLKFDLNDIKISHLLLCQAISEAVTCEDAKIGDFIDSVTFTNYGKETEIIVLKYEKNWLSFTEEKKVEKRSRDGDFWDTGEKLTDDEKWKSLFITFYVLLKNDLQPFPMFLSFSSSSVKNGKNFLNLIFRFSKINNEPVYARFYCLRSETQESKKGKYLIKTINPGGYLSEEEYKFCKKAYMSIKDLNLSKEEVDSKKDEEKIDLD